jgi:MFS family permease
MAIGPATRRTGTVTDTSFRFLWGSQAASVLGDGLSVLAVPLLVLHITHNPVAAALASATRTIGYLVAGLIAGTVVDRSAARRVMIVADSMRAGLFTALMLLALAGRGDVAAVLGLACAAAAVGVFYETASAVIVQDLLRPDELVRGNSRLELTNQMGLLIGSAVVGAVVAVSGVHAATGLISLAYVVSTVTALLVRVPAEDKHRKRGTRGIGGAMHDLRAGFRYVMGHPLVRTIVALQAVINFLVAAETLVIFFASQSLALQPIAVGIVVTASAAGGLLASTVANALTNRFGGPALIVYGIACLSTAIALISLVHNAAILVVLNLLVGAGSVIATVNIRALRQRVVPREMLGRVTSTARTLAVAAYPLGAVLAGTLTSTVTHNDPRPVFLIAGVLGVVVAVVAHILVLRGASRHSADSGITSA